MPSFLTVFMSCLNLHQFFMSNWKDDRQCTAVISLHSLEIADKNFNILWELAFTARIDFCARCCTAAGMLSLKKCNLVKFSFSKKATKICTIWLMTLTFTKVNVKTIRQISQILVAFSEKLNFDKFQPWKAGKKCLTPMITFQAPLFTKVEY